MKDITTKHKLERNREILQAAYQSWMNAAEMRKNRERNKRFTYGDQWCDLVRDENGRLRTEYEVILKSGKEPITNNLMRQLVKSVVGRFRKGLKEERQNRGESETSAAQMQLDELDSRNLEEFLISGCCIQRVDNDYRGTGKVVVENVNMNRFFVNQIVDVLGRDCEILGQLHDMSISELIQRISRGDREKATWLRGLYSNESEEGIIDYTSKIGANSEKGREFWRGKNGKLRVIEVWTLESREILKCHDRKTADYYIESEIEREKEIQSENRRREKEGAPKIDYEWDIEELWRCRWFSPQGEQLSEYDSPYKHGSHPYVVKYYPLTDGEVHSFVEDVIDQQKYVNRLITMIDHIMSASAKGVLLYPDTALPDGFTWNDIRKIWRSSNGILPYTPERMDEAPRQISVNGTNIGAYEMLQMQMNLFEEISGVSSVLQGRNSGEKSGAELYRQQVENGDISLTDIYDTYNIFRAERTAKMASLQDEQMEPKNVQ